MAELDWLTDILPNADRFPDSMEWPIDQDGHTVSLGTLRRAVVPASQLQRSQEGFNALLREKTALDRALVERLSSTAPPPTPTPGASIEDQYRLDPVLAPLWERTQANGVAVQQQVKQLETLLGEFREMKGDLYAKLPIALKTQQIMTTDPSVNQGRLMETATDLARRAAVPGAILDDAYKLMTYDQRMAAARAEGERVGREAAAHEFQAEQMTAPFMPNGTGAIGAPTGAPKFENDAQLLAGMIQDPDVQRIWMGQLDTLPAT